MEKRSRSPDSSPPTYDEVAARDNPSRPSKKPTPGPNTMPAEITQPTPSLETQKTLQHPSQSKPGPDSTATQCSDPADFVFCFDGGMAILTTMNDPPSLFQVSRSILAKESAVFQDLFAPGKLACYERRNGLPLIPVEGDPEDLGYFLTAMHYHREYFKDSDLTGWSRVAQLLGVLQMASRYQTQCLRSKMILHLAAVGFPSTLEEFDSSLQHHEMWGWTLQEYSMCLSVVREVCARRLLPSILYRCVGTPTLVDIEEAQISTVKDVRRLEDKDDEGFFSCPQDKTLCIKGREAMMIRATRMITDIGLDDMKCDTRGSCRLNRMKWMRETLALPGFLQLPLDANLSGPLFGMTFCDACLNATTSLVRKAREDFWNDMPKMFGVGESWEVLLADSEDA